MRSSAALRTTAGTRGAAGVIIGASSSGGSGGSGSRPLVVPYVPEELVSQAQVVLQGKSRNLIIRELQVYKFCYHNFFLITLNTRIYSDSFGPKSWSLKLKVSLYGTTNPNFPL